MKFLPQNVVTTRLDFTELEVHVVNLTLFTCATEDWMADRVRGSQTEDLLNWLASDTVTGF